MTKVIKFYHLQDKVRKFFSHMLKYLCKMKQTTFEIVTMRVRESGTTMRAIAKKMGYTDPNGLYYHLRKDPPNWDIIAKIGEKINFDFSSDFKLMPVVQMEVNEPMGKYGEPNNVADCKAQLAYFKNDNLRLHNRLETLQDELLQMYRKMNAAKQ